MFSSTRETKNYSMKCEFSSGMDRDDNFDDSMINEIIFIIRTICRFLIIIPNNSSIETKHSFDRTFDISCRLYFILFFDSLRNKE